MTYYDDLGVKTDASPDEIKRAYRAKARVKHPDKGGDSREFAAVANAYEVLKDPQRRLLYDQTGRDSRTSLEDEVNGTLMQAFASAVLRDEDSEILSIVRKQIKDSGKLIKAQQKIAVQRKKKLAKKRGRVKTTSETNLVHMLIDAELENLDTAVSELDHQTEIVTACLAALDTYSEDWKPGKPVPFSFDIYFDQARRRMESEMRGL